MKNISILFTLVVMMSSCFTERIDLDLNDENQKLSVDAWITDLDEPQYITLSQTVNYLGDPPIDYVSNAEVTLRDDSTLYTLTEEEIGRYYLPSNWVPRVGDMYELIIRYDGEEYIATNTMRPCPEFEDVRVELYEPEDNIFEEETFDTDVYEVVYSLQEIPGEGDGYFLIDYLKGSTAGDSAANGSYFNDFLVDGTLLEDITVTGEIEYHQLLDTAIVELHSIGDNAIDFVREIEQEVDRGSPFDAPPANVRSNVSNGAVGYFIIGSARRIEVIVDPRPEPTIIAE